MKINHKALERMAIIGDESGYQAFALGASMIGSQPEVLQKI
jgi:hypothetical protein